MYIVFPAASNSSYWAIQVDIKKFSKLHLTAEYTSLSFDFNVFKQANVNMVISSWQHYTVTPFRHCFSIAALRYFKIIIVQPPVYMRT